MRFSEILKEEKLNSNDIKKYKEELVDLIDKVVDEYQIIDSNIITDEIIKWIKKNFVKK